MKKRIWGLMLCLVLVCAGFAGCGSKDGGSAADVAPERMVKVKLQEFVDRVLDALESAGENAVPMQNVGYDLTAEVTLNEQIASSYGLTGLNSVGLNLSMDMKESAQMRIAGNLLLNAQDLLGAEAVLTEDSVYANLPSYSENYLGVSYEELLGQSIEDFAAELASANEGMPTTKDILAMWKSFSSKFIAAFEYQGNEEKQTIGIGDYKITGEKYITTAKAEDIDAAFEVLVEEMKKFPKLAVAEFVSISDGLDSFNANYYVGKNGAYAWEFEGVGGDTSSSVVFISAEKGFYFYVVDENGREQPLVFSTKESAQKGKITICAEEQIEIEYDNYTKNSVDLSTTLNGMAFQLKILSAGNIKTVDFNVNIQGVVLAGKLESAEDHYNMDASVSMFGTEFGSLKLAAKMRDFVSYDVPSSSVSPDEWSEGLDQQKLMGDLSQLMMQFPFLMNFMQ